MWRQPRRQFAAIRDGGGFALSWRAHGLSYGIPIEVVQRLDEGCNVVANLSRTAIDEARRTFLFPRVIVVSAPEAVIAARIAGRGRENAREIAGRLTRARLAIPTGDDVDVVDNDGDLAVAADRFIALLERHGA